MEIYQHKTFWGIIIKNEVGAEIQDWRREKEGSNSFKNSTIVMREKNSVSFDIQRQSRYAKSKTSIKIK